MAEPQPPSVVFLNSEGTEADFQEFWKKDPVGAAQYAAGLAKANNSPFEGLEEMVKMLDAEEPVEVTRERLRELGERSKSVFEFVQKTEAILKSRDETLGWSAKSTSES